ncbi:MAG: hypothetical protein AAF498_12475 [Pseudomonadota bacterium]
MQRKSAFRPFLQKRLDFFALSSVCLGTVTRDDTGRVFAELTAAYEGAAGVAVTVQGAGLTFYQAWELHEDLGLRLAEVARLQAVLGSCLRTATNDWTS